jgi:3'(2'), 5'-bisphosphate nucleotidase
VNELVSLAKKAAIEAGIKIMSIYAAANTVKIKNDGSPLTIADELSHDVIVKILEKAQLPIISEEGDSLITEKKRYWLIDPLDGTKDFLAKSSEFTINIALIENDYPVLGLIYVPALDILYVGGEKIGGWKEQKGEKQIFIKKEKSHPYKMAVSRFHDHPDVDVFACMNHIDETIAAGSALKFGLIATNDIDVYPRLVGSSEWDTAAGQAIVEASKGKVLDWNTGQRLRYGKEKRRNPRLLTLRAPYNYEDFNLKHYEACLL